MNRTNLINAIIRKNRYKSYLEIGIGTGSNFKYIACDHKISVDPDKTTKASVHLESDEYFATSSGKFDCGFIDGLHHYDQAKKDLQNLWDRLNDGGTIIMHDTNPHSEHITHVPRDNKEWCGDVYKLACQLNNEKFTFGEDHGVTVVKKDGPLLISEKEISWEEFDTRRIQLLNIKTWAECLQLI